MTMLQVSDGLLDKLRILKSLKGVTYEELIEEKFKKEFDEVGVVLKERMNAIREIDGGE